MSPLLDLYPALEPSLPHSPHQVAQELEAKHARLEDELLVTGQLVTQVRGFARNMTQGGCSGLMCNMTSTYDSDCEVCAHCHVNILLVSHASESQQLFLRHTLMPWPCNPILPAAGGAPAGRLDPCRGR